MTGTLRLAAPITVAALVVAAGIGAATAVVWTQERPGQAGRGPGGPGASPVFAALDTDHDGTISRAELASAPAALKSLDKNNDGTLTPDEMRPAFGRGGREGPGGRGRGGRGDEPGETAPTSPDELASTLMAFDRNGDGKLTRAEVPERMQGLFDRADADKDGSLTVDELKKSAASQPTPSAGGPDGRGGDREGEGRRGRGPDGGPPRDPLVNALDTNHDGVIGGDEIAQAAAALSPLDKDGDGQLTIEEVRPAFGRGRGGVRPGPRPSGPAAEGRRMQLPNANSQPPK